jgi:hypothetical protein
VEEGMTRQNTAADELTWYERVWNRPTNEEIVEAACEQLNRDLAELRTQSKKDRQDG